MTSPQPEPQATEEHVLAYPARGGPTVLRILLGTRLRRLRESRGISREAAGRAIRGSQAKICRLELGQVGSKERDVTDLLTLYGVVEERQREDFLAFARRSNAPGWWNQFGDVLPRWFEMHIGLEEAACVIRSYELQFVPGLLQTADYARAVARLDTPIVSPRDIERRVRLRMARQELLTRPDAPKLWAVVDEAALRRPLNGPDVMRAQLQHLIDITKLPNVSLQIVPFRFGGHAAAGGPFTLLRFCEDDLPDVVYLEQLTSATYLDKVDDVETYAAVMNRLCVEAEPPSRTAAFLRELMKDL